MGQTRRAMVKKLPMDEILPEPTLPAGESRERQMASRPKRGKSPDSSKFEAMPGGVEGEPTLPQDPKVAQPIEPIEPMEETTTKRRRKKIMPDATLVNTNNLLGTGGSL